MTNLALDLARTPAVRRPDHPPPLAQPTICAPANDDWPHLPERLAPDVPPEVGFLLVGPFAWTIGAYLITFWSDLHVLEMVVVDIVYVSVYLGVPWIILRMVPKTGSNPTLADFLSRGCKPAPVT